MRSSINPSIRLGISLMAGPVGPDMRVDTRQSAPFEVDLIFIISLHKFRGKKFVKIHKNYQCF